MIIIKRRNKKEEENTYRGLKEFSREIIELGKKIEKKLKRKKELEDLIRDREKKLRALQSEIFKYKEESAKIRTELLALEKKRKKAEEEEEL